MRTDTIIFTLREGENFIPLIHLLKAVHLVGSGSEAQIAVTERQVQRNGSTELRKRAKITAGDCVCFQHHEILVQAR